MAAIPSNLTSLDFTEIRESIRSYLRTRDEFTDYDFDGSAASYLLDVLSYNTYYASFNANMAMNEAFLESATIRDNVVKIAKQLNYTPRSIKAPKACIAFSVQTGTVGSGTTYPSSVTLKKVMYSFLALMVQDIHLHYHLIWCNCRSVYRCCYF